MARPVKSVQLQYEEGPRLSLSCLRNRIERLEEYSAALEVRLQRLHEWVETLQDGQSSRLDKCWDIHSDWLEKIEVRVDRLDYTVAQVEDYLDRQTEGLPEVDIASSQQLHADQLRANRM